MGEFSVQAEQTFRPPVQFSQSDCFIVTSCWVWGIYTHSPFAPRLFSESTKDMILQVFQQNNHSTATCHSNVPGGYFTVGAGSIVKERMGGTLLGQHCSEAAYVYLYRYCVYKDFVACWTRPDCTCHKFCICQQLRRGQIMCRQPAAATSCEAAECCANRRQVTPYWSADMDATKTSHFILHAFLVLFLLKSYWLSLS